MSSGFQLSLFTADSVLVDLVVAVVFALLTVFFGAAWGFRVDRDGSVQWTMLIPAKGKNIN